MFAVGTLDLSNNNLSWNELLRIRHVYVLDLRLYGNDTLENVSFSVLKIHKQRNDYKFHCKFCQVLMLS